jgi:urease gamma subunit
LGSTITLILNNGALIYSLSCSAENTVADSREGNGYSAAALEEIDRIRSTLKEESIDAKTAVTLLKKLNSILGNEPVLSYVRMLLNMDPIEAKEHANKLGYKGLQREL